MLDVVLENYKFKPFKRTLIKFLKECEFKERDYKIIEDGSFSGQDVYNSLLYRYPVYFGRPIYSLFKEHAVPRRYMQPFGMKYVICGRAYIQNTNRYFIAIHTWAPNFESESTVDYKNMVRDNKINLQLYTDHIRKMFNLIAKAGVEYKLKTIYSPAIGQGAYMHALNPLQRKRCFDIFVKELEIVNKKIRVIVCTTDKQKVVGNHIKLENLFEKRRCRFGLVNAWDSYSYIGNGLSRDPTIDGYYVAGYGPNKELMNSSYLHNPIFNMNAIRRQLLL